MIPPKLRPSSLPALAVCPCYAPDESTGQDQKSDGTKRHTALGLYLVDDPTWATQLGEWDAGGVEWAGEYIRAHAPLGSYPLEIEQTREAVLSNFEVLRGTPDIACGPFLADLKGRNIDSYKEQIAGYVLLRDYLESEQHVLYSTERTAKPFRMSRDEAEEIVEAIAAKVADPERAPKVSDWCDWCANRKCCPAFNAEAGIAAEAVGVSVPFGTIEEVTDADGLAKLKEAARILGEWAKTANEHVNEWALQRGVVPTGYVIRQRKGNASVVDTWAAIAAAGLVPEQVAEALTIKLSDMADVYAKKREIKPSAAKAELEQRLGPLIQRAPTIRFLQSI